MTIKQRKKDHVELTTSRDVAYHKSAGFERYDFVHNALPELNIDEVSLTASLLGKSFSFPLFISSMTGGYTEAGSINGLIAEFCEKHHLPFGVGSQRIMLENPEERESFSVVRKKAPNTFIAANIGGSQLIGGLGQEQIENLVETIRADAIIVHLNALQELIQPEGDHNFSGIEEGIAQLITHTHLPVIVKETGAGISGDVARRLLAIGVRVIDVAGAGGTSWSRVERLRNESPMEEETFDEWGIPTVQCLEEIDDLRETFRFDLISSGGIRTSHDMMKSIALGADFTATAQPVIQALSKGGLERLEELFERWKDEARIILTLLGCRSVKQLRPVHLRKV
ncbi:MAG: type 2 isopentenyl-diphosphate Delta-isomerase [Balneolaceae bacterium]